MTEPVGNVFPHMGLVELQAFNLDTSIPIFVTNVSDGGSMSFSIINGVVSDAPRSPSMINLRLTNEHWEEVDNDSIRQSLYLTRTNLLEFTGFVQLRSQVSQWFDHIS